jgi:hypothetical protein
MAAFPALPACDSGESTARGGEKWLEAPDALNTYQVTANINTMESNPGFTDAGCEAVIEHIRESLIINPGSSEVQVIVSACNNAGLEFGKAIRCKLGRLQVKCR